MGKARISGFPKLSRNVLVTTACLDLHLKLSAIGFVFFCAFLEFLICVTYFPPDQVYSPTVELLVWLCCNGRAAEPSES